MRISNEEFGFQIGECGMKRKATDVASAFIADESQSTITKESIIE
jgi:hypothetical protein